MKLLIFSAAFLALTGLGRADAVELKCPDGSQLIDGVSEDGRKAQWCEQDGEKEGPYQEWYGDGQKKTEGSFHDGKYDGEWIRWYANGKKKDQGKWHVESWAMMEPSTNSTIEWTTLCGCTTTPTRSISMLNNQRASIIS